MIQIIALVVLIAFLVATLFALVLGMLMLLAMACAIGIPLYFIGKHWFGRLSLAASPQSQMERLKNLYIEGKIDLGEYEQRVAQFIAVDRW